MTQLNFSSKTQGVGLTFIKQARISGQVPVLPGNWEDALKRLWKFAIAAAIIGKDVLRPPRLLFRRAS